MALSERSRSTIYQTFEPVLGEEVIGEMLSYFPARDVEEPATKEFVRAEIAGVHTEMAGLRTEIAELRAELHVEIAGVRATMHQEFRSMLQWLIVSFVAIAGLMLAAARFLL